MRARRAALLAAGAAAAFLCAGCGAPAPPIVVVPASSAPRNVPPAAAQTVYAGPGVVSVSAAAPGYRFKVEVTPNRASGPNTVTVRLSRAGTPVEDASVDLYARMLTMDMGTGLYTLDGGSGGLYHARTPAWLMPGQWELTIAVTSADGRQIAVAVDDTIGR